MALYIEYAPVLADVLIGGNLDDEPAFSFCPLSSYLGQLEILTLEMSAYNMMFPKFPELTKLRHLAVSVYGGYDDDLLVLTSLIDASPSLRKLSLELKIWRSSTYHHAHSSSSVTGKPIPSLEEVEIVGFRGFKIDVDFVTYLLEHGEMIEKITINCCHPSWIGQIWEWESIKEREKAREHALQLGSKSSPTTEFVVV
ncbi:Sulfate transporter 91 [Hibiscus syriacus]|uniref:Sulfate transporter 91 n=1 Tax=Hibiscus syriacus TaxID=106335 RepID=A0A6A2Z993_HIBSY|nr:Sulfate transporter 91 [Hibiscus syriacus]